MEGRGLAPRMSLNSLRDAVRAQDYTRTKPIPEFRPRLVKQLKARRPLEHSTANISPARSPIASKQSIACLRDLKRKQVPSPELGPRSPEFEEPLSLPKRNLRKYHSNISLGPRSKHSRSLIQYPSKLDLLDSDYLTSFPLPITEMDYYEEQEAQSPLLKNYQEDNAYKKFSIIEDYIPIIPDDTKGKQAESQTQAQAKALEQALEQQQAGCLSSCDTCSIPIKTVGWFKNSTVVCPACYKSRSKDFSHFKSVTKVESSDNQSLFYALGEIRNDVSFYSALQNKLRWRWRLRGLI